MAGHAAGTAPYRKLAPMLPCSSCLPLQVGRVGGLLLGAQTAPMLQLDSLFAGGGLLDRPAWATAVRQCQLATSYAVAYQPTPGAGTYGGRFTAAVELVRDGKTGWDVFGLIQAVWLAQTAAEGKLAGWAGL